jgi:eukaryotic-like serine/threonine-protein kinase
MLSERAQRQVDRLLDEADEAIKQHDWTKVLTCAREVLHLDPENVDAHTFLAAAERAMAGTPAAAESLTSRAPERSNKAVQPASFCAGRYEVKHFLGEGGKKLVYLAHDTKLDRDVAFALIKIDGLDEEGLLRIKREAQAMGRLGDHPHIVSVFDIGDENGQPYLVSQLMGGGDVEGLIQKAEDRRVSLDVALKIADEVCQALEHAHSHGIVHRDLKPGNVWLTADGTAKLGDFGLAVALDRSRLTQAGMMVGTVSYMPPEQAIGGEVTPRSDLYSLGAMLYELATGRPPFVGNDSVAIIGQHLNTPPVAPSWHARDLPSGLEVLILRLLEKDPMKRPASAADVRQALASITLLRDQRGRNLAPSAEDGGVEAEPRDNPLYRRTFVGREAELHQLQAAFDAALSGRGTLMAVVGEPSIGKTALCEQLATYAAVRGGRALVGHCYEEGSLSFAYLAFVEALRSYALSRPPAALRDELGSGAREVARIVSEVRDPPGRPRR